MLLAFLQGHQIPIEPSAPFDSQRTCTRPAIVCTPVLDKSISSRLASFNLDSPIG
jgi:hypothetical protein